MSVALPAIQQLQGAVIDAGKQFTVPAYDYFSKENAALTAIAQITNTLLGVNTLTLAQAQALSLGVSDAGYTAFITDYAHLVYWDGTAWQWLGSDLPGQLGDWVAAPSTGWALCDGSATTFLTIGATLGTSAFTTPNLAGTPTYKKSDAAYSGTLNAASGSTATGSIAIPDQNSGTPSATFAATITLGGPTNIVTSLHVHDVPSQTVTVPSLGVGTIDMPNLSVLPYVRR